MDLLWCYPFSFNAFDVLPCKVKDAFMLQVILYVWIFIYMVFLDWANSDE